MIRLWFTETEFALLAEAQGRSDRLTALENRAFSAMRGLFDDGTGAFTRAGPPDRTLARGLLHGDDYLQAKAAIMEPIGQFQELVNSRTESVLSGVRNDAKGLLIGAFLAAGSLLGLLLLLSVLIYRRVLLRSGALAEAAERITAGDLDVRSGVRGSDELGVLAGTFDNMVARLTETLALVNAAKERMEEELKVARDIQMSMIPLIFPVFEDRDEISVHAGLEPAREVGGDFYDFYFVDADHLCCVIGDVSGKGAGVALFMAVSKTLIKSKSMMGMSPSEIMTQVNGELSENNDQSMFVTVFLGILNVRHGAFRYCNAGHNPSYVLGAGGSTERLDRLHGPVIGAVTGLSYTEDERTLLPGDKVYMYTDGVTEAMNKAVELYTEERMVGFLESNRTSDTKRLVEASFEELKAYTGGADPVDDITVVALDYLGG